MDLLYYKREIANLCSFPGVEFDTPETDHHGWFTLRLLSNRFNSITQIAERSFAGLRKLELLMMHGNDIHKIPDGVFRYLLALQLKQLFCRSDFCLFDFFFFFL